MSNNLIEILRAEVRGKNNATKALNELEQRMNILDVIERCLASADTSFDSFTGNMLDITIHTSSPLQASTPNPDYSTLLLWYYEHMYKCRGMTPPTSKEKKLVDDNLDVSKVSLTRAQKRKNKRKVERYQ